MEIDAGWAVFRRVGNVRPILFRLCDLHTDSVVGRVIYETKL